MKKNNFHSRGFGNAIQRDVVGGTGPDNSNSLIEKMAREIYALFTLIQILGSKMVGDKRPDVPSILKEINRIIRTRPAKNLAGECQQVIEFFNNWHHAVMGIGDDEKGKYGTLFLDTDPAVLFPFLRPDSVLARRGITDNEQIRTMFQQCVDTLNELCPQREEAVEAVVYQVFRRLMGDYNATFPLLIGDPGCGKTEIARRVVEALWSVGLKVVFVYQSMTEKNGLTNGNQTEMKLLGTDSHWSNAKAGKIFHMGARVDVDLCIVLLDEADKHDNCYDLMVNLLDPNQPLADTFVSGIWEPVDLRHKVMFLLSANDDRPLRRSDSDPLWSRLEPIFFEPYAPDQLVALLADLGERDYSAIPSYQATKSRCRKIAADLVEQYGTTMSFRRYLNCMGNALAASGLGIKQGNGETRMPQRPKIGFF